jgi:flagellar biosynthetic protein FlhB
MADIDKTEKPTPRRRRKAREEGSVARSMELNSAVVLLTGTIALFLFGAGMAAGLGDLCRSLFRAAGEFSISTSALPLYLWQGISLLMALFLPFFALIIAAGISVNLAQVGFLWTGKPLMPRLSRLSPMKGAQRFFSPRSLVELAKSVLKLGVVGLVVYLAIRAEVHRILELSALSPSALLREIGSLAGLVSLKAAIVILLIALLDYAYTRYEHEKSLKMSKQEVKEEARQSEGDPQIKAKIRGLQIRAALRRMMRKVPQADVVITNPVHLAVALKYDGKKHRAPVVLAKGARLLAERIKEIAREHDIPIVENPPLAQALYYTVDVGQEIPIDLYRAVAEILAFVYRLKRKYFGLA